MMPDARPDSIGADQRHRLFLLARRAAALDHGQSLGVGDDILELAAEPQFDIGIVVDMGLQRCLQIGAVQHPIGRVGPRSGAVAQRQAGDFAAASRAHDADGVGRDRARREPRLQSEFDQHAAGIGRKLQAGAGFLEAFGLFKNDDAKALSGERKRCRQSSDPGTCDHDGARRGHQPLRRPCLSARIRAAGLRRRQGRRRSGTASSNRGR